MSELDFFDERPSTCQFAEPMEGIPHLEKTVVRLNSNAQPVCSNNLCPSFQACKDLSSIAITATQIRLAVEQGGELDN